MPASARPQASHSLSGDCPLLLSFLGKPIFFWSPVGPPPNRGGAAERKGRSAVSTRWRRTNARLHAESRDCIPRRRR